MASKSDGRSALLGRASTFVSPQTGEVVQRYVTLRNSNTNSQEISGQDDALIATHASPIGSSHPPSTSHSLSDVRDSDGFRNEAEQWMPRFVHYWTTGVGLGVLKCTLAYFLASLATFVPALSSFLGHQDGKHMVATVVVYFHPARSQGSMLEAILWAAISFVYATFISFASMGVSIFFDRQVDLIELGHIVVVIVFCGGGLGLIAWTKQRLSNPTVNVASSLTSLAIITVLTKEGAVQAGEFSYEKVFQVLKMILLGILASTSVCLLVRPTSARKAVKKNLIKVTDAFALQLGMITRAFLIGASEELEQLAYQTVVTQSRDNLKTLQKDLREARWEQYFVGHERIADLETGLVKCVGQIAQSLDALRSAAETQFLLLAEEAAKHQEQQHSDFEPSGLTNPSYNVYTPPFHSRQVSSQVTPAKTRNVSPTSERTRRSSLIPNTPVVMFDTFMTELGPATKSLALTLKQILDELPYTPDNNFTIVHNPTFRHSLDRAIHLYGETRKTALDRLYHDRKSFNLRGDAIQADFEEVAASCGYFSISLLDLADRIRDYLTLVEEIHYEQEHPRRSWTWLKIWKPWFSRFESRGQQLDENSSLLPKPAQLDQAISKSEEPPKGHEISPDPGTFGQRISKFIWHIVHRLAKDDISFAIKVGIGAAIFATPSYLEETQEIYAHWRGEWGLLSYMLVCANTIGAANTVGVQRIIATFFGAGCAIAAWLISNGNVYAMAFFGMLVAALSFWISQGRGQIALGRFTILTYNLSALYAYSLSVKDEWEDEDEGGTHPDILNISLHRVVAVSAGCLWGLVVTRMIWPISARSKFRDGLSLLLLQMAMLWKRNRISNTAENSSRMHTTIIEEEASLQAFLSRLQELKAAASFEFELRAPFPSNAMGAVLGHVRRMLDIFHAMNAVMEKDRHAGNGKARILRFTQSSREHLDMRVSHLLQVLASSVKLEYTMTDALPSIDHSRDRLLARMHRYREQYAQETDYIEEDFALLYAYALVTGQLAREIDGLAVQLEKAYGTSREMILRLEL